ncbi:MAG: TrkA family potassium uptake protein [Muribaculaceae bacterium]|nr:TrkA family potassium uptake protein [Muribaculaceae bacterium]
MKCIIIGLGIYGSNLARDLSAMGNEVVAVDSKSTAVENVKDYVATVYQLDSTDEHQMSILPVGSVDLVIVAIGENFGASVKTVAILKKMGARRLYARAIDELHNSILECFQLDRILTPEQRAASDLTLELALGARVETMAVNDDNIVVRFTAPEAMVGLSYANLGLIESLSISLVAATRPRTKKNLMRLDTRHEKLLDLGDGSLKIETGDILTCFGSRKSFRDLRKEISLD